MGERICPNDPSHKRFYTTAHVTEEWLVDEQGAFIEAVDTGGGEAVHGPNHGNSWTCAECGCSDTHVRLVPTGRRDQTVAPELLAAARKALASWERGLSGRAEAREALAEAVTEATKEEA